MSHKGKKLTEEHKRKIGLANSIALKGRKNTVESNLKRSFSLMGRISPMRGKKQTIESNIKRSMTLKGKKRIRPNKNRLPREIRFCACGCGRTKEVRIDSFWSIFAGCRKGKNNSAYKKGLPKCKLCGNTLQNRYAMYCRKCRFKFFTPWNKGLTKKTDDRVERYAHNVSKTIKYLSKNNKKYIQNHFNNHWSRTPIRENTIKKCLEGFKIASMHPNKFEIKVENALNEMYPGQFKYVGNKRFGPHGHNPDFINVTDKIVILCNGCYWHLEKRNLDTNYQNKKIVEKIEAEPFTNIGYKVVFIWDDDKSFNVLKNIITE